MEKKYLLPPLQTDIKALSQNCWKPINNSYDFLLKNLKLRYQAVDSIFDGNTSAFPHIFEQMLLFHKAFFDKHDPDHQRAILEWRAALSIMALPRICNYKLELVKVDFSKSVNSFINAGADFLPKDPPLFFQTTWDFLYIVRLEKVPIAIVSPITILCPAKQFKSRIAPLEWLHIEVENGEEQLRFQFNGQGEETVNIVLWLDKLRGNLAPFQRPHLWERAIKVKEEIWRFEYELAPHGTQNFSTVYHENAYPEINNSIRKEYQFLNNCCDFHIDNPDMKFLIERYHADIFQSKLAVILCDERPDSMLQKDNIPRLDKLFSQIVKLHECCIINVYDEGGERMAACALLPFQKNFVDELIQHNLTPEDVLESCSISYEKVQDALKIVLHIRDFPYFLTATYQRKDWVLLYEKSLPVARLWPSARIGENLWHTYCVYLCESDANVSLKVPGAAGSCKFIPSVNGNPVGKPFQIATSTRFPSFLRYFHNDWSGYLPICSNHKRLESMGGTALILLDIGHSTTAIRMIRMNHNGTAEPENIPFQLPRSVQAAGSMGSDAEGRENFLPTNTAQIQTGKYFKNMLQRFCSYERQPLNNSIRPFEDGMMLFEASSSITAIRSQIVSFLNFEYAALDQEKSRSAHMFIEQILLYAAYVASLWQCSYLRVGFLHGYLENNQSLGELEGVFQNAIDRVKEWSGLQKDYAGSITYMHEGAALLYRVYQEIRNIGAAPQGNENEQESAGDEQEPTESAQESTESAQESAKRERKSAEDKREPAGDENCIYAGVDIGWKKTIIGTAYCGSDDQQFHGTYTRIEYAGRDISLMNGECDFRIYPKILSILLRGTNQIGDNTQDGWLLREFNRFYANDIEKKNLSYYQGLFDVAAMRIEQENYVVPPDIYNRMDEFRAFLKMLTYNILLLFLGAGYTLGKLSQKRNGTHLHVYLTGNGAKLLNWIMNLKNSSLVDEENDHKIFILELEETVLDAVKEGFQIATGTVENLHCTLYLLHEMKGQLLEGYVLKEQLEAQQCEKNLPRPDIAEAETVSPQVEDSQKQALCNKLKRFRKIVFDEELDNMNLCEWKEDIGETLRAEAMMVCSQIIEKVNQM